MTERMGGRDASVKTRSNPAFDSCADLTRFGKSVVEDPKFGLLAAAAPATVSASVDLET